MTVAVVAVEFLSRVLTLLGGSAAPTNAKPDAPKRQPPAVAPKPKPKPKSKPTTQPLSGAHIFVDGKGRRAYALSPDGMQLSVARLLGLRGAPDDGAAVVGVVGTVETDARPLNEIDTTKIRWGLPGRK